MNELEKVMIRDFIEKLRRWGQDGNMLPADIYDQMKNIERKVVDIKQEQNGIPKICKSECTHNLKSICCHECVDRVCGIGNECQHYRSGTSYEDCVYRGVE